MTRRQLTERLVGDLYAQVKRVYGMLLCLQHSADYVPEMREMTTGLDGIGDNLWEAFERLAAMLDVSPEQTRAASRTLREVERVFDRVERESREGFDWN
jgi:hypothetical protein